MDLRIATILAGFSLCATVAWAEGGTVAKGQTIFLKYRCKACHSIKAVGIEKKAEAADEEAAEVAKSKDKPPDLSGIGMDHNATWFAGWLLKKEMKDGKTHKKKFRGTEAELKTLTQWIASLKMDETGKPKKAAAEKAQAVEAPAEKAAAEKTPAEKTPAAEPPATETPAEKTPAAEGGK